MNPRHAIIDDKEFWSRLERAASAWLSSSEEKQLRRFWIDGFSPETATDTQRGADVEGVIWLGEGSRQQHEYHFIASVPQKLLHHPGTVAVDDIVIDGVQRHVALTLSAVASHNQAMERTADRREN